VSIVTMSTILTMPIAVDQRDVKLQERHCQGITET
jgi:hypothetical protein